MNASSGGDELTKELGARILERAAEIDAASAGTSDLDQLRAAATEAGISVSAFDAAARELLARESPGEPPRARGPILSVGLHRSPMDRVALPLLTGLTLGSVVALLGAITRILVLPGEFFLGAVVTLVGVVVGMVMYQSWLTEREGESEDDTPAAALAPPRESMSR